MYTVENAQSLSRREQIIEVLVFLLLIAPTAALSFFAVSKGSLGFVIVSVSIILRDLSLLCLVLFFLWRNGEPLSAIGWGAKDIRAEIALGIVMFIPMYISFAVLENVLFDVGLVTAHTPLPTLTSEKGMTEFFLAFVLVSVVAVTEETIFRGYLILRFRNISSSIIKAVFYSSFIFALGHGYEGTVGVVTVGLMGGFFALVYLWRGSIVAPMVMHLLQDFVVIVVVPYLRQTG